ncbi:prepilin-type N-terminal cleavage/methylation domain-containing protein [Myxococcus sp. K38C18041901]|uniref:type IV pilus modification PilV family protein n=1 Tax=Myxococcus guangdongensis TaxID=2906760 RepID=UPI0020A707FF|nr:prepilin-type N-terminal cleavage/methylation domain-containing protein [Myxococcus guangdongensis]MCP3063027.1 prepilin-type N-terminal cleavage/methylation domain-containing protein [Myxococcus guangdongensis]
MKSSRLQTSRGVTLLEVLATMAVMLVGIAAVMMLVTQISASNRRTLTATQAQLIAERTLESITSEGCTASPPCSNLAPWDNRRTQVWQTAAGELRTVAPPAGMVAREYEVAVDIDSPSVGLTGSIENGAVGLPAIDRQLGGGLPGNVANVRVSVSWTERGRQGRQVVVMQTRMAP